MKRKIILGPCLLFLLLLPYTVKAETIILSTDKDTYIDKVYPASTLGKNGICWSAALLQSRQMGYFILILVLCLIMPSLKDAKLTFLVHANHSTTKYFIHPLSTFWQEDAATWNLSETGINWGTPGGDYDPALFCETTLPGTTPQWMVTDVTSLVSDQQGYLRQGIADNGLLIRGDAGYNKILSSEFSTYDNAKTCHSCHGTRPFTRRGQVNKLRSVPLAG